MAITPSATPRVRSRAPGGSPAAETPASGGGGGWMKTGQAARQVTQAEIQRQQDAAQRRAENLYMPFRFRVPVGEQRDLIILDNHIDDVPFFYEHNLRGDGKWNVHETCPREFDECPICTGKASQLTDNDGLGKESYYVMMMTGIDLTPWTDKKGVVRPYSKFLVPVKTQGHGFFLRQADRNEGRLRGLHLLMSRDAKTQAATGVPEFVQWHSEEEILAEFGHPEVKAQDGKVLKEANADCFPYPYAKLFPRPSGADLRKRYGGQAPAGSREANDAEWGNADMPNIDGDDSAPF